MVPDNFVSRRFEAWIYGPYALTPNELENDHCDVQAFIYRCIEPVTSITNTMNSKAWLQSTDLVSRWIQKYDRVKRSNNIGRATCISSNVYLDEGAAANTCGLVATTAASKLQVGRSCTCYVVLSVSLNPRIHS